MKIQLKALNIKILALLLVVSLVFPGFNVKAAGGVTATGLTANSFSVSGATYNKVISHYNYYNDVYTHLTDKEPVYKTQTYEDIAHLFDSAGTYVVLFGGAWSENTQATIGFINDVAKEYGINTIYNFDTRLDGKDLEIADSNNKYADVYGSLVKKYLTNLHTNSGTVTFNVYSDIKRTILNGTYTVDKIPAPFLFTYNKDNIKDAVSSPIISSLEEIKVWSDFLTNGVLDPAKVEAYKAKVRPVFEAIAELKDGKKLANYNTIDNTDYFKTTFNTNVKIVNSTQPANSPPIFDNDDGKIVFEHVTYDELLGLLNSKGNYAILFGGSWCPNTQADVKLINQYAKLYNIDTIYMWDPRLDAGVDVTRPVGSNSHDIDRLMVRDNTLTPYTYLYVDMVKKYLTNIATEYKIATTNIKYTKNGVEVIANRAQVPYLFTYNKDNKDAAGNSAPILGHVELMYYWNQNSTNVQPTYTNGALVGGNYNILVTALKSLYTRLEATPTGLAGIAPTSSANTNGSITGVAFGQQYKLSTATDYINVTGDIITDLVPGTYNIRYAAKNGYNGPVGVSAGVAKVTAVPYTAGESIDLIVPGYQAPPTGLAGVATTTLANNDGQITGTTADLEYKLVSGTEYSPATPTVITGLAAGIYSVRYAAKNGYGPSSTVEVVVLRYQAPPSGLVGVTPISVDNNNGKITNTSTELEYKLAASSTFIPATAPAIFGLTPGTYDVRYAADDVYSASAVTQVIILGYQAAPTGVLGVAPSTSANLDGQITGTTAAMQYKLASSNVYTQATNSSIINLPPGNYEVRYAAKTGFEASPVVEVTVPAYGEQAEPTGLIAIATTSLDSNDGQITGTSTALEYKLKSVTEYTYVTGTSITGLSPGIYQIRFRAKEGFHAGAPLDIVVKRYQAPPTGLAGVETTTSITNNDGKITGTSTELEYKLEADTEYTSATEPAITGLVAGTYIVRKKATATDEASSGVTVIVLRYQAPPTGLAGVAPTTSANNDGQITGTTIALEYKLAANTAFTPATEPAITGLAAGTYQVRYKATGADAASSTVDVVILGYQASPTGLAGVTPTTLANNDGQITGTTTALEYKLEANAEYSAVTGTAITGLAPGIYNVRYKAKEGYAASSAVNVAVLGYQAPPIGLTGVAPTSSANNDGKITGTTTALEYKLKSGTVYNVVTGAAITGLVPGTYNVRYAAKVGYSASQAVEIVVAAYSSPTGGTPTSGPSAAPTAAPTATATPAPAVDTSIGKPDTAALTVPATTDPATGATTATVSAEAVTALVENAKKDAAAGKSPIVEFKVEANTGTKSSELTIPASAFSELTGSAKTEVKVDFGIGSITFDGKAAGSINPASGSGDISIKIVKVELSEESKQVLGDRPVYDFTVTAGGSNVSTFGGGSVNISVPYTLKAGEEQDSIIVYYVNDAGELETIRGKFNSATGSVDFGTKHFSKYIVGYNKVTFADISASAWYSDAVGFLAARSITSGTGGNKYSPNATVTRGQFIALLLKAYGVKEEAQGSDNFADAGNTYYTNYLSAAKKLGITTGIGGNKFAPDAQITRQDLFTLLYKALDVLGELPKAKTNATVSSFSDAGQIASYAQEAFQALVESGVITGSDSKLSPKGVTTRAQVAQVLYNLFSK